MANVKPEDGDSVWQGYSVQAARATAAPSRTAQQSYPPRSTVLRYPDEYAQWGRTQRGTYQSLDAPSALPRWSPQERTMDTLSSPPPLTTHHSFPSLKRAFGSSEDLSFGGNLQEFREDISESQRPAMNQDHRLLSFARLPDKYTIVDSKGHMQRIELAAQIHGMFFLSELATTPTETILVQPELTCYRRNLFQISGNVTTPRASLSLMTEMGESIPIVSTEVTISATESVDGHIVKLIVIPWKTPPPHSPELPTGLEHEPASIPLLDSKEESDPTSDLVVHPIAYRRLQFRIATANNGRRRELQQHFTLHLNVVGTLSNGVRVNVCENSTAPIVVRGRSPRNFQARKEIPLMGSSSSRGQPELHIATNISHVATQMTKPKIIKPHQLELPKSPFTFDSSSISGSPSIVRQVAYPAWSAAHTPDRATAPDTLSYPVQTTVSENHIHVNRPNPELHHVAHSPATSMPPIPHQYAYSAGAPTPILENIQFLDSNPRPTKSPRHAAPPEIPSNMYTSYGPRFAPPYTTPGTTASRASEYFPQVLPMHQQHTWTSGTGVAPIYETAPPATEVQQYDFANQQRYVKEETSTQPQQQIPHHTWHERV